MTDWETLKVAELKEELKSRGVPLTGLKLKQQFIDKLNELDASPEADVGETQTEDEDDALDRGDGDLEDGAEQEEREKFVTQTNTTLSNQTATLEGSRSSPEGSNSVEKLVEDNDQDGHTEARTERSTSATPADEVTGDERVERLPDELPAELKKEESQARDGSTPPPIEPQTVEEETAMRKDDPFILQNSGEQPSEDVMMIDAHGESIGDEHPIALPRSSDQGVDAEVETRSTTDIAVSTRVPTPEILDDQRKRKRRSITPTPDSEDMAHKRRRTSDEMSPSTRRQSDALKKIQQNTDAAKAIRGLDRSGEAPRTASTKTDDEQGMNINSSHSPTIVRTVRVERSPPPKRRENLSQSPSHPVSERQVPPARHPATRSLYIRNFKRPLNIPTLRSHISSLASQPESGGDPLKVFYLDSVRTHAFVSLTSVSAASRVRNAMHGTRFPDEPMREPLWIDFVPDEKVQGWIDQEAGSAGTGFGGGRGPSKKYEVIYSDRGDGVEAIHQEASTINAQQQRPEIQPSRSNRMVPQDPSASAAVASGIHPSRASLVPQSPSSSRSQIPQRPSDPGKGFRALDELFSSTAAKPKLYYQLPPQAVIDDRLDMIRELRINHNEMGKSGDEGMKRYSFERDERAGQDEWVDKGPEFGFGRRGQERLTGYGNSYGGGRGRGAFRGGRRGGDSWRGR